MMPTTCSCSKKNPRRGERVKTKVRRGNLRRNTLKISILDELKSTMLMYPHCGTFAELVSEARGTSDYDQMCNCYLDHRAEKLWSLARDDVAPPEDTVDLLGVLHALPDSLPNTLSPEQTLAVFNSWCAEQRVNAYGMAWFIISRLEGRVYKKNRPVFTRGEQFRQDLLDLATFRSTHIDDGQNVDRGQVLPPGLRAEADRDRRGDRNLYGQRRQVERADVRRSYHLRVKGSFGG